MDRVPEFWKWLLHLGEIDRVKMPVEIHEEVGRGNDVLSRWIRQPDNKRRLVLNQAADPHLVNRAATEGYAHDLSDEEIEKIGRDPFLVAYALRNVASHCIVTAETSQPKKKRANRKLPDVATHFGIRTCDTFALVRELDFRTERYQGHGGSPLFSI